MTIRFVIKVKILLKVDQNTIIWIPIFGWYMLMCGSKNWHQKDKCLEEIELHAQNTLKICFSIFVINPSNFLNDRLF